MNIAIITGASAGLGQAFFASVVKRYPTLDKIWLIARRAERLAAMAEGCPIPVEALSLDLTVEESYAAFEARLAADKPSVQIFINNAGLGELNDMIDSDWQTQVRMVDLNCRGLTAMATAVLPYMTKGGFIINVASIAAFAPNARMTVYSATKAFDLHLSRGLREEMRPRGVNVLAVCPGPMATEFLDVADIKGRSATFERLPYCDPKRVADRAVVKAAAGRGVYTPRAFFKFYRMLSKILPTSLVIKMCKT
jgi:short-subunit dehydrogenase